MRSQGLKPYIRDLYFRYTRGADEKQQKTIGNTIVREIAGAYYSMAERYYGSYSCTVNGAAGEVSVLCRLAQRDV